MAEALGILGLIVILVGGVWLLVVAFQESVGWGLGCLFIPFVSLIFLIAHWNKAKNPFFVQLGGLLPLVIGVATSDPSP